MKILKYILFLIVVFGFIHHLFAEITADDVINNMRISYLEQLRGIDDLIIKIISHNMDISIYKKKFLAGKDAFLKTRIEAEKDNWQMLYINDGNFFWSIDRIFSCVEKQKRRYADDELYFLSLSHPELSGIDYLEGDKAYILKVKDIFSAFGTRRKKKWEKDLESIPARIWIDGKKWVVLKMELSYTQEKLVSIYYKDYRNISGKWVPYRTEYYSGSQADKQLFLTDEVTQVMVNTRLDDNLFDATREIDALGVERVNERNPVNGSLRMQWYKRRGR